MLIAAILLAASNVMPKAPAPPQDLQPTADPVARVAVEADVRRLPDDVARCHGVGDDAEGWRDGCDDCLRRLAQPLDTRRMVYIEPPAIIAFWCEYHVA